MSPLVGSAGSRDNGGVSIPGDELHAAVEARRELGVEREREVLATFLDRVERGIDERVDARLAGGVRPTARDPRTPVTIASLLVSIPMLGICGGIAGFPGLLMVCIALVLVNTVVWVGGGGPRR
jgi:hypothetical protein